MEIRFTGEQLNQDDHDLLMQLIFMAREKPVGAWVTIPAHTILKALCRQVGGKQHRALRADIFHIPSDLVVDQWASNGESSSHRDVLCLHDV